MKLIELLNLLLSFGPKLPTVMEEIQNIVAAVQRIVALFASPKFGARKVAQPKELNAKEAALADKVMAGGKVRSRGAISNIFAWLKANPWAIEFLLSLLKSKQ